MEHSERILPMYHLTHKDREQVGRDVLQSMAPWQDPAYRSDQCNHNGKPTTLYLSNDDLAEEFPTFVGATYRSHYKSLLQEKLIA
jgi:hypothetical protein